MKLIISDDSSVDSYVIDDPPIVNKNVPRIKCNITIIGCISSGKSTLLNMIFGKTLSAMNIRRTTMTPCKYVINNDTQRLTEEEIFNINKVNTQTFIDKEWNYKTDDITTYNMNVKDTIYNINDCLQINIYDLPGINDQKTKNNYYEYVKHMKNEWNIIYFVIDINSGFNTSDEMEILNTIISMMSDNELIKVIIIINKCDNMIIKDDGSFILEDEQQTIYEEQIIPTVKELCDKENVDFSRFQFQPLTCKFGYVYRKISSIDNNDSFVESVNKCVSSFDELDNKEIETKYIEELMINEYGKKKWLTMSFYNKKKKLINYVKNINEDNMLVHTGYYNLISKTEDIIDNYYIINLLLEDIRKSVKEEKDDINDSDKFIESFSKYIDIISNITLLTEEKQIFYTVIISKMFHVIYEPDKKDFTNDTYFEIANILKNSKMKNYINGIIVYDVNSLYNLSIKNIYNLFDKLLDDLINFKNYNKDYMEQVEYLYDEIRKLNTFYSKYNKTFDVSMIYKYITLTQISLIYNEFGNEDLYVYCTLKKKNIPNFHDQNAFERKHKSLYSNAMKKMKGTINITNDNDSFIYDNNMITIEDKKYNIIIKKKLESLPSKYDDKEKRITINNYFRNIINYKFKIINYIDKTICYEIVTCIKSLMYYINVFNKDYDYFTSPYKDFYNYFVELTNIIETSIELMTIKEKKKYLDIYITCKSFNRTIDLLEPEMISNIINAVHDTENNNIIKIIKEVY